MEKEGEDGIFGDGFFGSVPNLTQDESDFGVCGGDLVIWEKTNQGYKENNKDKY